MTNKDNFSCNFWGGSLSKYQGFIKVKRMPESARYRHTETVEPAWYVVHAHSRHEVKVESGLQARGLVVFLPRITVRSHRRDRLQFREVALFPGYLFVHTDLRPEVYGEIIRQRHVVRILGSKGRCTQVPAETVLSIQAILKSGKPFYPWPQLAPGRRVQVVNGPLAGAVGTIRRLKPGKQRLVVGVEVLGRSVAVDLWEDSVEPFS
jgi:transcription termination/antitermination protein NusG